MILKVETTMCRRQGGGGGVGVRGAGGGEGGRNGDRGRISRVGHSSNLITLKGQSLMLP